MPAAPDPPPPPPPLPSAVPSEQWGGIAARAVDDRLGLLEGRLRAVETLVGRAPAEGDGGAGMVLAMGQHGAASTAANRAAYRALAGASAAVLLALASLLARWPAPGQPAPAPAAASASASAH